MILGIDLGTTACKAVVVSEEGRVAGGGSADYPLHVPRADWAEQDVSDVWQGMLSATRAALASGGCAPATIEAIGLSGAMHSLLPLDSKGQPLGRALTWADQRGAPHLPGLRESLDAHAIYQRTGCPIQSLYWPCKLLWFKEQRPDVWRSVSVWASIKDYILGQLTGRTVMEHSMASATGLLDIHSREWLSALLDALSLPPERLPELASTQAVAGGLTADAAEALGLLPGTAVIAGATDGALANLGAGAIGPGRVGLTIGTSGAVRLSSAEPRLDERERTWCYILTEDMWLVGGAINNGGIVLRWARDEFAWPDYDALMAAAGQIAPGAEGLLFLPYLAGERSPYWNARARGVLFGLSLHHSRAHIARALMEGVAFRLYSIFKVLEESADVTEVRATGGFTQSELWVQIVADVLGHEIVLPDAQELSALGASYLAMKAMGRLDNLEQTRAWAGSLRRVAPDPTHHTPYVALFPLFEEIYWLLTDTFDSLQRFQT
jgi:gluconokinase